WRWASLLVVLEGDRVLDACGQRDSGAGVRRSRMVGPVVDQQLPIHPESYAVVREGRELKRAGHRRLDAAGPAHGEVVDGNRREGAPCSRPEENRAIT